VQPDARWRAIGRWLAPPVLLIGAGLVSYHNSFRGAFIFDDMRAIADNPGIRHLWPPWSAMTAPPNSGVTNRPIVTLSLAVSYALDGLNVRGYHITNLAIHILAGLLLYGIVRRMLGTDKLRDRYGSAAPWLAVAAAVIWLVHPLQTESVTYIIQRAESLMGLFLLLTLYCSIRAFQSPRPPGWYVAAVIACALGMASKEVMVAAPVLVLLYDRMFVCGSLEQIFRRRWSFYAGLALTWLVLGLLLATMRVENQTVLIAGLTPWRYAITQFGVIVHYLRLSFWPHPLVFDYLWPLADRVSTVVPWVIVVLALAGATVWAVLRGIWVGFWGAWFFLILAPTSSVIPIGDVVFEHRMYLPLAAVTVLVVVGGHEVMVVASRRLSVPDGIRRWAEVGLVLGAAIVLGHATIRRNEDYVSELAIYRDTVAKRPDNPRAHNNLGVILNRENRPGEAERQFSEAVRLKPDFAEAHSNLGAALLRRGQVEAAVQHLSEAVRLMPDSAGAHHNLGLALLKQGDTEGAITQFSRELDLEPDNADAHRELAAALAKAGRASEAMAHLARAARSRPTSAQAHNELGNELYRQGKITEAVAQYSQAIRLDPGSAEAHHNLGLALVDQGDIKGAIAQLTEAVRLKPDYAKAHNNLGILLYRQGRVQEAVAHFSEAVRLQPDFPDARNNLRAVQGLQGQRKSKP
jgi:Flp pilus assembly protein TadD